MDEQQGCLFTDQSRFNLHYSNGSILLYTRPGEWNYEHNMDPYVAFGDAGTIVSLEAPNWVQKIIKASLLREWE